MVFIERLKINCQDYLNRKTIVPFMGLLCVCNSRPVWVHHTYVHGPCKSLTSEYKQTDNSRVSKLEPAASEILSGS